MLKFVTFAILAAFSCMTTSQVFFDEEMFLYATNDANDKNNVSLEIVPGPLAMHCLNRSIPELNGCTMKARHDFNTSDPIKNDCCQMWQSLDCGINFMMDKCSKAETVEVIEWIIKGVIYETKRGHCKDYEFKSDKCQKSI